MVIQRLYAKIFLGETLEDRAYLLVCLYTCHHLIWLSADLL